jgi:hypothetical protein
MWAGATQHGTNGAMLVLLLIGRGPCIFGAYISTNSIVSIAAESEPLRYPAVKAHGPYPQPMNESVASPHL